VRSKTWRPLPFKFNFWDWSHDSQYLYFDSQGSDGDEVLRYRIKDGKIEKIASLTGIQRANGTLGAWFGLGPGDAPMIVRNTGIWQIYAIDWDAP
jgi:hypothetical protein